MELSIFGGLAKGYAMGRQQKREREKEHELNELRKQHLKGQAEAQKVALEEAKRKSKLLDMLFTGMQGGQEPQAGQTKDPAFSESFGEGPMEFDQPMPRQQTGQSQAGLTETMAGMDFLQDPKKIAMLKMAGIDLTGAANLARPEGIVVQREDAQGNVHQILIDKKTGQPIRDLGLRSNAPLQRLEVQGPGGETTTVFQNIRAMGGQPQLGPRPGTGIQTKPGMYETPIGEDKLSLWRNMENQSPSFGTTPAQAMEQGFTRLSKSQTDIADGMLSANQIVGKVETLMGDIFPESGGAFERGTGGLARTLGAALQTNEKAAQYNSLVMGTLAPLIRALGEKGTLAEGDTARAKALYPNLSDSANVAWLKMTHLKDLLQRISTAAQGGSYDVKKGVADKQLTRQKAAEILGAVKGDKDKARKLAKEMGYEF